MSRTYRRTTGERLFTTAVQKEDYLKNVEHEHYWVTYRISKSDEETREEAWLRISTYYKRDMWGSSYKLKGCMKHEANRKRRTEERSKLRKSEYPEFKPFKRYSNIWDWD